MAECHEQLDGHWYECNVLRAGLVTYDSGSKASCENYLSFMSAQRRIEVHSHRLAASVVGFLYHLQTQQDDAHALWPWLVSDGVTHSANEAIDVHCTRSVQLVSSLLGTLHISSHAMVEVVWSAEGCGTVPGGRQTVQLAHLFFFF